jgi:hypothetical protein
VCPRVSVFMDGGSLANLKSIHYFPNKILQKDQNFAPVPKVIKGVPSIVSLAALSVIPSA